MKANTIGLDIAKSVFQVHVEDGEGRIVSQRRLRRSQVVAFFARQPASVVGIEACGSAHCWGRLLWAQGHEVRLIPAAYVKPFVRRNKTDARDAAAICVAVRHPDMRFVRIKSAEQQASRGLERSRELLVRQHTQLCNSVRGQLAEHGIVAAPGRRGFITLTALVASGDERIPEVLVTVLRLLLRQTEHLATGIAQLEERIVAAAGDGRQFRSARDFAAWAGLTPQEHSSAGKRRDKGISRQGDSRLRKLFALGASTIMRNARSRGDRATQWQRGILARRPMKVAVLAQTAKTARIAWAVLTSGEDYQPHRQTRTIEAA